MGRRAERGTVEQLLTQAGAGRSATLLVRGEAGIGKTALMEQAREAATSAGFRVEASVGVEAEAQFAFAGLHQLCGPMLGRLEALPDPQQAALGVAFGLRAGAAPDRFLVGLATLTLMAEVAEEAPLLCLVDDAQWLDEGSAQVLAFVARRVAAERVALIFGLRDSDAGGRGPFAGLPEVRLAALADADALSLLTSAVRTPLDNVVRDRILAEARGNPLALLELPRGVALARLAGGFDLPDTLSVPRRVEDRFKSRLDHLPAETQLLLLIAGADPTGETELLWRAASHVGIAAEAAEPAEVAGLLEIDTCVRFRHPLVRSAVYQAAAIPDRRRAHGALAVATDPAVDPDRRAWHRAQAAVGTDEDAAADLERSADRARARGGVAAAAAFLQRAAELTPDAGNRAARALEAAHATHDAGSTEAALRLLTIAASGPPDDLRLARVELLRARSTFRLTRGTHAATMLLEAARSLVPLDEALAREAYVEAIEATFHAGRFAPESYLREVAAAAQRVAPPATTPRPVDLLLDGLSTRFTRGYEASVPSLQRALESLVAHDSENDNANGRWFWLACHVAAMLWDDEALHTLATRAVRVGREAGTLATLPSALNALALTFVLTGELRRANELFAEEDEITRATAAPPLPNSRLSLAAWRGTHPGTPELIAATLEGATTRREGLVVSSADIALAYLHNGLGNFDMACVAASRLVELDELAHSSVALPELVEAAVRAGRPELAAAALATLESRAGASGTQWGLGMAARSRALVTADPVAEDHYREAIERLGDCRMTPHLARAHLVYGEWLRREGRRLDARDELRTAHGLLSDMGAEGYAERAARELRATGEHPRKRGAQPTDALTAQEAHIARLVATGATSREVAAQLFLSPRTIEAHLRSIFRKLGITSRRQLKAMRLP
ncbi:LuxR family transcriptional regulator [Nocardioides sp. zg-1230]|uniref:AAA family ATPase n=1 Tax=Nocardioides sp. zg-1230 TaxID=2736601 RepID=UPI00155652E7|nr:AAA family ATPase [Nocardioides sp. zg-1230]